MMQNNFKMLANHSIPVPYEDRAPKPPKLNIQNLSEFPKLGSESLRGLAGDVVRACTAESEATTPAVLFYFLQRFGCQIGAFAHVAVGEQKQYARLNVVLVGETAKARKGTSMAPVDAIFNEVPRFGTSLARTIPGGNLSSGEGLIAAVADESEEKEQDGQPKRYGVSDKRCLVVSEEFASALAAMKRQGSNLSAFVRCLWDIGCVEIMTKNEKLKTTNAHVCLMFHITNPELKELMTNREVFNGFVNRFLWVKVRREKLVSSPKPIPQEVKDSLAQRIAEAARFGGTLQEVKLSATAAQDWHETYVTLNEVDKSPLHEATTSRDAPYILRLALIYAILDLSSTVESWHLQAAIAAWNYCDESARQIFENVGQSKDQERKAKILSALAGKQSLKKTDFINLFNRNVSASEIKGLIDELVAERAIQGDESTGYRLAS